MAKVAAPKPDALSSILKLFHRVDLMTVTTKMEYES